jgi:hypothetical protein
MKVRLTKTEQAAETWCIEAHGAEPHDIEERDSAVAYVEEICDLMGYDLKWTRATKGELVEGVATIKDTYTACVGCMSWESPHIVLTVNGKDYVWLMESEELLYSKGKSFPIRAFAYDYHGSDLKHLRKVKR